MRIRRGEKEQARWDFSGLGSQRKRVWESAEITRRSFGAVFIIMIAFCQSEPFRARENLQRCRAVSRTVKCLVCFV
jgi:hypothetical protein